MFPRSRSWARFVQYVSFSLVVDLSFGFYLLMSWETAKFTVLINTYFPLAWTEMSNRPTHVKCIQYYLLSWSLFLTF